MKEYLIGEKLSHSYSVYIHALFGGEDYALKPVKREDLAAFMRKKEFSALNVTIPYKKEVMQYLDEISPLAKRIGAVNAVVNRDGALYGDNTDYFGFARLAESAGICFAKKNVLILGTGGTSETAEAVVKDGGARRVIKVSRSGSVNYDNVYDLSDTEIIVNTTPVGMFPALGKSPLDLSRFPALEGALDVIYNPLRTDFILQAISLGVKCAGGLAMLVAQGARARELFDNRKRSEEEIAAAIEKARRKYENIVLVGMPGSGKSVVGREVAKTLCRTFYDCDAEIEKKLGKSIPEVFAERGEGYFRAAERETIAELSAVSGAVISTGGGAVLDGENVHALKRNGRIYYLRRDINKLARKGRPLSASGTAVKEMFQKRKPLYEKAADEIIDNDGTMEDTLAAVLKGYKS